MRAVLGLVDMGTGPQNSVGQLKPRPSRAPAPLRNRIGANLDEANSASRPTSTSGKTASDLAFRSRREVLVLDILINKVVVVVAGRKDRSWRD